MQSKKLFAILSAVMLSVLITVTFAATARATDYKVLYRFSGEDGRGPEGRLATDVAGNLYGTTEQGGANGVGTVFKLEPNPDGTWTERTLYNFDASGYSRDGVILDAAGNLYGTTTYPWPATVFKLAPNPDGSWTESTLWSFTQTEPTGTLILDPAGNLYGATAFGGAHGWGSVFKLTPNPDESWSKRAIHSFTFKDGAQPYTNLVFDPAGNLYGTTQIGGNLDYCDVGYGCGVVFRLAPNPDGNWLFTNLHHFKDDAHPGPDLSMDVKGNIYGTTWTYGTHDRGTVFKLTPNPDGNWTKSKLHTFTGKDGDGIGFLVMGWDGNLYGTTQHGGAYDAGVVFKLTANPDGSWRFSKLQRFKGKDAWNPQTLILDDVGNLYGTALGGLSGNGGVVFKITP